MSAPKKASRLELVGVAGLLVVGAGAAMYLTSPTVSGQLTVGTRTLEAERCSGFVNGVEIWLAGEGYDAITAGARADGSLRLTYNGEEVSNCTEANLSFAEGVIRQGRSGSGPGRPVIQGQLELACTLSDGTPLRGRFDFARCRQD